MRKKESEITKIIVREMQDSKSIRGQLLWQMIGLDPLPLCRIEFEKKAGAKADGAFLVPNGDCLLIENKCNDAKLQQRQDRLYMNHFLHFYDNCNLKFSDHKLVFLVDKNSNYLNFLSKKFNENYRVPETDLGASSHLKNLIQIGSAEKSEENWLKFNLKAMYKKNIPRNINISVKILGLDFNDFHI